MASSSDASARSEPQTSSSIFAASVQAVPCTVRGHSWRLEQLKRGPTRVEVCRRCGAVESYLDLFKQFSTAD